jgi:hypothetical protein
MFKKSDLSVVSALLLSAALALPTGSAAAKDAKSVVGTYTIVSVKQFGDNPRGQMTLGSDGRYSIILARATLPKVASGARDTGTAEENKAITGGSIAHFGKYTVDAKDKTITFKVETSTFPNWDSATFKRPFKVSGDQLSYTNNAPSAGGGATEVVWKRVK